MPQDGERVIADLLPSPTLFDAEGRATRLLQAYFNGLSLATLVPLLRSEDVHVQRNAAFIVSELGSGAIPIVDEIPYLLMSKDRHVIWYTLEALTVCSMAGKASHFVHVVEYIQSSDVPIRRLAMRLTSRTEIWQLESAMKSLQTVEGKSGHVEGLRLLMEDATPEGVTRALGSDDPVIRRYAAIAVRRASTCFSIDFAGTANEDDDFRALIEG